MRKVSMVDAGLSPSKRAIRPVTGILLLALWISAVPAPSMAQTGRRPPGASPSCPQPESYTLGAGDRVQLDVFNVPEYSREYQVLADGTLSLPIVGTVPVRGLTLTQAADVLRNRYGPYLRRPIITVNLTAPRPLNVAIAGEVIRPGSYSIPITSSGAGIQLPTVSQAIRLAGGITQSANLRGVQLRRPGRGTLNLNLWNLVQGGDLCQDVALRDGDSIVIPTGGINLEEAPEIATSSIAPEVNRPLNVLVVGEVTRPGPYIVQPDQTGALPTVTRALQVAGGIKQTADISQVQIRRQTRGVGAEQTITVDISQLLASGDRTQDLILQQGDTVIVPAATQVDPSQSLPLASTSFSPTGAQPLNIAVAGEVQRPGTYVIQPAQPPTVVVGALPTVAGLPTVTQAIQLAGGITQSADVRRIEVRRTTQGGAQQTLTLNFWQLLTSGDRTQDVILQQGDTVFIPTAATIDPAEAELLAQASFSPATIPVNIVGEVVRPGTVQIPPNTPLNQAILAAGGFNNARAKKDEVVLLRLNPNGTVSRRTINIDFDRGVNEQSNPTLRPNDVVVVSRSGLARTADTLGTVLTPIGQGFSFFNFFRSFFGIFGVDF